MEDTTLLGELNLKLEAIDNLLLLIDNLLKQVNKTLEDIGEFVIVNGPGSYAGIRMSLSAIKTLAFVKNIPLKTVNTVELMAYNFRVFPGLIVVAMESRKDEVNFGFFGGNPFNILISCETIEKRILYKKLEQIEGDYILVGDLKEIPEEFSAKYYVALPLAREAILLAFTKESVPLNEVMPIYSYPVNVNTNSKKKGIVYNK